MGSLEDLIDFQEGKAETPDFQVRKGEEMSLSDSLMKSEVSLNQQRVLTEREDQRSVLIIGGIQIFLPSIPVEATTHFADAAVE